MNDEILSYYRLLSQSYARYLRADALLAMARDDMRSVFPPDRLPYRGTIGDRGSRVRRLHEDREAALLRLQSALDKYRRAKQRAAARHAPMTEVRLLSVRVI